MLNPQDRSRAFNFALKAQETFGFIIGLFVIWSIYALTFTQIETLFISKVLLSLICIGFGTITPLIDFNESHATNPLWTGHARFHLVWQVNAMIFTAVLSILLLWIFYSMSNHLIVILLNFLWIFSFYATVFGLKLFDFLFTIFFFGISYTLQTSETHTIIQNVLTKANPITTYFTVFDIIETPIRTHPHPH